MTTRQPSPRLSYWHLTWYGSNARIHLGYPATADTSIVELPEDASWLAPMIVEAHNAEVQAAGRPSVDVEAMLTRIAVATVRELARGLLPRRLRRQ